MESTILHKGQHIYRHSPDEFPYSNQASQGVHNVKDGLDYLFTTVGLLHWKEPVATINDLPIVGNSIGDARIVQDADGLGNPAAYICVDTVGNVAQQWQELAAVSWGAPSLGQVLQNTLS